MTLMEMMVVLTILTVALSVFSRTLVSSSRLDPINRETVIAAEGARSMMEEIRNNRFADIFALYNADPADDPGGAGTAPGIRFTVANLEPLVGEVFVGTILLPEIGGELREDFANGLLGMPRDLNGDGEVDTEDHAEDAVAIPIGVRLDWNGAVGPRSLEMYTLFGDL
jgi:hypothetical protein